MMFPAEVASARAKLLSAGSLYAVATVAPIVTAAVVTPLVTRLLGAERYGFVALFLAANQIGQVAAGLGLPAAVARRVARQPEQVGISLGATWALTIVLVPAVLVGLAIVLSDPDSSTSVVVGAALASSSFLAVFTCVQSLSRGLGEVRVFVVQSVALALGGPLLGFVLAYVGGGFQHYLLGMLMVQAASATQAFVRINRHHRRRVDWSALRVDMRIGLPTVPHQLAMVAASALLVVLAGHLVGPAAAGELQLSVFVGTAALMIIGALNNSWSVQFYATPSDERGEFLTATTNLVVTVASTGAVMTALLAPFVVNWLAAPEMDQTRMIEATTIATASTPLMAMYLSNVHVVFASGRTALLAIMTPATLLGTAVVLFAVSPALPGLVKFSVGVPLFYAGQTIWSWWLRRRLGLADVALLPAYALTVATLVTCGLLVILTVPSLQRISGAVLVGFLGGWVVVTSLWREKRA